MSTSPTDGTESINFRAALAAFQNNTASSSQQHLTTPTPKSPRTSTTPSITYTHSGSLQRAISPSSRPDSSESVDSTVTVRKSHRFADNHFDAPSNPWSDQPTSLSEPNGLPQRFRSRSAVESTLSRHEWDEANWSTGPATLYSNLGAVTRSDNSRPSSPERRDSTASSESYASAEGHAALQAPHNASRQSSTSSTSSLPRLPPRSAALAPSPIISEFGHIVKDDSSRRFGARTSVDFGKPDKTTPPPALPPRSVTIAQAYSDAKSAHLQGENVGSSLYAARRPSPLNSPRETTTPSVSATPKVKPTPPPRPSSLSGRPWDTTGLRLSSPSSGPDQPNVSSVTASAQPMLPQRPTPRSNANRHSKVSTSINLSEEATRELQRSINQSPHKSPANHRSPASVSSASFQLPPPTRGRPMHSASRSSITATGAGSSPSGISSLLESAASALPIPLFKSGLPSGASRALADGAPSKQGSIGARHSFGLHPDTDFLNIRPGDTSNDTRRSPTPSDTVGLRLQTRAVRLAETRSLKLAEPANEAAQTRYETLYDALLTAQNSAKSKRDSEVTHVASNASTLRGTPINGATQDADTNARNALSLRGWSEPEIETVPRPDPGSETPQQCQSSVSAKRVRRLWRKSRLPDTYLAKVWEAAIALQGAQPHPGMLKGAFVRGMATVDAELLRRKTCAQQRANKKLTPTTVSSSVDTIMPETHPVYVGGAMARTVSSNGSSHYGSKRNSTTSLALSDTPSTTATSRRLPPPPPTTYS